MKRHIFPLISLLIASASYAYQLPDSTSTYKSASADSVIIIQNKEGVTVNVINTDANGQNVVTFSQPSESEMVVKTRTRSVRSNPIIGGLTKSECNDSIMQVYRRGGYWDCMIGGLSLGFTTPLSAPSGMNMEMGKSLEVGILYLLSMNYHFLGNRDIVSVGLGLNWRNFRTTDPLVKFSAMDNTLSFGAYPDNVNPAYSRIKIFSLSVPLTYRRHWHIPGSGRWLSGAYVGGIMNFNTYGSILTKWQTPEGHNVEEFNKRIGQRHFTVDILAGIRIWDSVSLFAKYSPMKVLERGPQFSSFTTGIMIGM